MYKHNKGTIKESAIKALVRDPLFSASVKATNKWHNRQNLER